MLDKECFLWWFANINCRSVVGHKLWSSQWKSDLLHVNQPSCSTLLLLRHNRLCIGNECCSWTRCRMVQYEFSSYIKLYPCRNKLWQFLRGYWEAYDVIYLVKCVRGLLMLSQSIHFPALIHDCAVPSPWLHPAGLPGYPGVFLSWMGCTIKSIQSVVGFLQPLIPFGHSEYLQGEEGCDFTLSPERILFNITKNDNM